ncbi:MAG TPA: hypothetical protein VJQ49_13205, partial [Casimicrobiaceae bacterium]|nr:hypothetical protein [Casimicrobiaceae bacterium]
RAGLPVAGFARGLSAAEDVARWAHSHQPGSPADYPALIWIGSPAELRGARLAADGATIRADASTWAFDVVPRIALNRSYYNAASTAYFAGRTLKLRGSFADGCWVARTLWPEDFRLGFDAAPPSAAIAAAPEAIRALLRADPRGGAQSAFSVTALWERSPGAAQRVEGKAVLAAMLNGAQGDDDEAHGGHFAMVTGRVGERGAIDDWLASNFYALDVFSEKGIVAAVVPLDNYLTDLNSGQAWYRPSHLIVAVLSRDRAAGYVQSALNRVYNQFYRHQLVYGNVTMNCSGISIDALRALGWPVRARGPTSRTLAWLGLPLIAARERDIGRTRQTFDYLCGDRTRVFPAAAFEETAASLLQLAGGGRAPGTEFETALGDDIEALLWLRVPQLPSSRAWGDFAVVSGGEYGARLPADRSKAMIVPVPPRPFPAELRDPDLLPPAGSRSRLAAAAWTALLFAGIAWLAWRTVSPHL